MKIRLFSIFFLLTGAILADNYRPPNMEKDLFDVKKLSISDIGKTSLFAGLLSVARDFDEEENEVNFELRSNALAIAGRLEPKSENFKDVLEDLKQRSRTTKQDATKSAIYSKLYRGIRTVMRKDENKDNLKCAAYCIDIALRFQPDGKYQDKLEKYQEKTEKADWKDMLNAPVFNNNPWGPQEQNEFKERRETIPGGEASEFKGKASEIYGLHVMPLSNGKHVGGASAVSAIALKKKDIDGIEFHIGQQVGNATGGSLKVIANLMQTRHDESVRPNGYEVSIKLGDGKPLDGPSAGTAFAILVDSLFTGRELDGKFACTGAISQTGRVMPIGGVAGKIRGATNKGCNLVGVPHENIKGVSDILVLDGIQKLIDIQVFSFERLDEAIEVASKEKSETVQSAIDDFAKVAELLNSDSLKGNTVKQMEKLKNQAVIQLLRDLVEKMPNHQSAKILLSVAEGKELKVLSLGGSFNQIRTITSGISRDIYGAVMGGADLNAENREEAKEALSELEEIKDKLDTRLNKYSDATIAVVRTVSEGRKPDEKDEDFVKRLKKEWDEMGDEHKELMETPEIREEMNN
jgi:hypothetical protein